jgi:hypothetical protein
MVRSTCSTCGVTFAAMAAVRLAALAVLLVLAGYVVRTRFREVRRATGPRRRTP